MNWDDFNFTAYTQEKALLQSRISKLEQFIEVIAKKIGLDLESIEI